MANTSLQSDETLK